MVTTGYQVDALIHGMSAVIIIIIMVIGINPRIPVLRPLATILVLEYCNPLIH